MTNTRESSDPVFRRLVDGGLLYDADHECIHHLNETATLICESWRQGMSQEDIVRLLRERYEVETAVSRSRAPDHRAPSGEVVDGMTRAAREALHLVRIGTGGAGRMVVDDGAVAVEGLEGLFVARAVAGTTVPSPWRRVHARTAAATTVALQELAGALRALAQQGHVVALLPGASLLRFYPDAGCRPMDDVDLLCEPGRVAIVAQALAELGWVTTSRYPDLLSGRHVRVDLHQDLFHSERLEGRRQAGWLDPVEVWSRRRRVLVEGIEVWVLSAEDEVLYSAAHALRHSYRRVTWLVDLALQLRDDELDIRRLRARAEASGLDRPVLFGLSLLQAAGVDPPEGVRSWYHQCAPGAMTRHLLGWILGARQTTCAGEVLWNLTCPTWRDRLRLMVEFVFPRPEVLLQVFPRVPRRLAAFAYALRCGQLMVRVAQELVTMTAAPLSRRARRG